MGSALRKASRLNIPPRDKSQVVKARPAEGYYDVQLASAFQKGFQRYEKALEELSKV